MNDQASFAISPDVGRSMSTNINEYDWKNHPLGEIQTWPQALRNFMSTMLASRFPMYLSWGREGYSLYNDGFIPILTDKHPNALGARFEDVWKELTPDFLDMVAKTRLDQTFYYEDRPVNLLKNGKLEECFFTFSYSSVRGDSGDVEGFYVVCLETTDTIHAKQGRTHESERLRALFQQAPGYIAVVSGLNHTYEIANDAYHRLIGNRQLIGRPVCDAVPELVAQGYIQVLDEILRTGKAYVGRAERVLLQRGTAGELEERFLDFILQPIVDSDGTISGVFIEGSDVTSAVNAATILKASEERLRQLANNIPHLAWMANPDGHIHWYNDRWYEYTGTTFETMAGWGWKEVHDPAYLSNVVDVWSDALANGHSWEMTFPLRSANGEFRMFASRATPLRDEGGKIMQWFGTNTDVTDEIKAQDELRKAGQRKDEFLAMLAHELRNPLAPINSAADLLIAIELDPAKVRETAKIISRQVGHITKLVDDLLDVSRVTRGLVTLRAETVDLNVIVAEAIEQVQVLADGKQHTLVFRRHERPLYVRGDHTRLIQVFANLLNNAIRYTPSRGTITAQITVSNKQAAVSVVDNGIGILPGLAPHVFDLFTQGERSPDRSQGGLGLGLALVKSIVELHEGGVSVRSGGAGKGAEFIVELPHISATSETRQEFDKHVLARVIAKSRHLMIVDDNQDAALVLSMLLETAGHTVLIAQDGYDALKAVQETMPEMCFLDIGLPDMDGYELAKRLRQLHVCVPLVLVAVTGYGQPEDRKKALDAGFDYHLVKPVGLSAILELVEKLT